MKGLVIVCALALLAMLIAGCQQQPSQELKFTKVTAPLSVNPEDPYGFHIPQGSVVYHWANGITEVYGPDNTRILIAKDSEATMIRHQPATRTYHVPNGTWGGPDESGKINRNYLDDTLILTIIEKDENYPVD